MTTTTQRPPWARLSVLELGIAGRGDLVSARCGSKSGPECDPRIITTSGWIRIITEAAENGVEAVRFVGGDPIRHLGLSSLIEHALSMGLGVDVASNLVYVTDDLWEVLSQRGVSLNVSFYTADPSHHAELTGIARSWILARENIVRARWRNIPIRAEIIETGDGESIEATREALKRLGITDLTVDRPGDGLGCGQCGSGRAAISNDGTLSPCVIGGFLVAGNVRDEPLGTLLESGRWKATMEAHARLIRNR
jgi:MoaA/NifB/PqqE/SkfB family radical SAM enzyme